MDGDDPPVAFDGGGPWTRKRILYRLNDRLGYEPGIEYTRFDRRCSDKDFPVGPFLPADRPGPGGLKGRGARGGFAATA